MRNAISSHWFDQPHDRDEHALPLPALQRHQLHRQPRILEVLALRLAAELSQTGHFKGASWRVLLGRLPRAVGGMKCCVCITGIVAVALAGCTSPSVTPSVSATDTQPSTAMAPWVPTHQITLPTMSDEDANKIRADSLAQEAKAFDITDPPDVALIRWVSYNEVGSVSAQCLRDAGFNVIGAGTLMFMPDGIPPSQASAFNLASYVCDAQYSVHPKYAQPMTADQYGLLYDYTVEWEVPCLATFGFTPTAAPTRETFISQSLQQGKASWNPWEEAETQIGISQQKVVTLTDTCPQYPPVQYLWG